MTEDYRHPEILDTDPYGMDKVIYSIHPFLPFWGGKALRQLAVVRPIAVNCSKQSILTTAANSSLPLVPSPLQS